MSFRCGPDRAEAALFASFAGPQMAGEGPLQLFDALAGDGRDGVKLQLAALDVGCQLLELAGVGRVDLGGADDHGFVGQRVVGLGRLAGAVRKAVELMAGRAARSEEHTSEL